METVNQSNYPGKEKLSKLLGKFAIPCILSLIISCLYNIVDQIFVGNRIGTVGNAATGIIFPITVIGWGAPIADVLACIPTVFIMFRVWKSLKEPDMQLEAEAGEEVIQPSKPGVIITIAREHGSSGKQIVSEYRGCSACRNCTG